LDAAGNLVHRYGPHIFHTNSHQVVEYLSRFTEWRPYEHRVLARVGGQLVPIPINRTTVNRLYGLDLASDEATAAFFAQRAEPVMHAATSEQVVVGAVGRELYELFFRGYTRKQWGLDPSELDASVTARVPTRTSTDDRYFTDRFQAMPLHGYTRMFERMLTHARIDVRTGTDFAAIQGRIGSAQLIYTGPIDEFFGHRFGRLPYRSLQFQHQVLDRPTFQPVGTINEPDEQVPYTRTTEFRHLTGQRAGVTSIVREFPSSVGDPYYPIPRPANAELYRKYEALGQGTAGVHFVGRLATYKYYNMDQVVAQALTLARRLTGAAEEAA